MKNEAKISIIIPYYNSENYILETLESILNQTFVDYKVILVDDGSGDLGINKAERFMEINKMNYEIIRKTNGGVSSARNKGIDLCKTKYIYIMDSDDIIEKNLLKELYKKIESENSDLAFCGFDVIGIDGEIKLEYDKKYKYLYTKITGEDALRLFLKGELGLATGNIIYRTSIIKENNIYYSEQSSNGEDQEFWGKVLFNCKYVSSVNNVLFHYMKRELSITNTPKLTKFQTLGSVRRLKKYLDKNGCPKDIVEYLENNKFASEFIVNLYSIVKQCKNIDILLPIIKNKRFNSNLKNYKLNIRNKENLKIWILIKLYILNNKMFCIFISKLKSKT